MPNGFGHALKTLRADLGLSQLELSHAISSTQRHVSFLETGRSQPTREFITRICTDLSLSLPQRAALFEASGHDNPFKRPGFGPAQTAEVLDLIERRALRHWPFPAFALDLDWNVLRTNAPGQNLLTMFATPGNAPTSLFDLFLSDTFVALLENWRDVSLVFYFRMQAAARRSPALAEMFDTARASGKFDHIADHLAQLQEVPPYVPARLRLPDGTRLAMSSFVGKLASIHDASIEGIEIELMVPMDEDSEGKMLAST